MAGDDRARGALAEELDRRRRPHPQVETGAALAPDRHLGERHGQAPARDVLRRAREPCRGRLLQEGVQGGLALEVDRRRAILRRHAGELRVDAPGQPRDRLADEDDQVVVRGECRSHAAAHVLEQADDPDLRRRGDGSLGRLVVETDVATGDREAEGAAGVAHAADRLGEPPERLWLLGVAEVEAVGDAQRTGACHRHVADRLGDGEDRPEVRIERRDRGVRVGRGDEPLRRPLDAEDGGAALAGLHRVGHDRGVVLAAHPGTAAQVRAPEEGHEDGARVGAALGEAVGRLDGSAGRRGGTDSGGRASFAPVDDRLAGDGGDRDPRQLARAGARPTVRVEAALDDSQVAPGGHPPDHRGRQSPAPADLEHLREPIGAHDRAHPLLRLADHHLERRHPLLAPRHGVEVDDDAGAGAIGHLGGGAADAAGAEVLQPLDEAALDQLQRRLDQELLGERVADLDRRPLGRVVVGELGAREDARPADPIAPGRRAVEDDEVPGPGCHGARQVALLEQPDRHDVDERVCGIGGVEDELAADGRDTDAVAVTADDDAVDEVADPRPTGVAEPERVEDGDRAGTHGEDVAQDPTDAGRRALVRLDRAGVVVALQLEGDGEPVPDRDDARVLSRPRHEVAAPRR